MVAACALASLTTVPPESRREDTVGHVLRREDAESILRERRARVRICAWCESVCVEGTWFPKSDLMTVAWHLDRRASHTICPACFDGVLPGVPYPTL